MRIAYCLLFSLALQAQPARVGVTVTERKLTLEEAIQMALKSNLDIEIERANIATAQSILSGTRGVFDGIFRYTPGYENRNTPTSSILFGADGKLKETFNNHTFSYLQKLEWNGANLQAVFDNSRQTTTNPFVGLNPATQARLSLGITLPLWRNRLIDKDRAEIRIRSKNTEISQAELELRIIDTVSRVQVAYWDLVAARQSVTVAEDGVNWGLEQLARTRRAIDAGTVARVEIAAAEAELERRRDTYFGTINGLTEAENALKVLISANRDEPIWTDQLIPADERTVDVAGSDDLSQAMRTALDKRTELRHVALRVETNRTQKELAQDQVKPQVNLTAGYGVNGLAGTIPTSSGTNPFNESTRITFQRLNELSAVAGLPPVVAPIAGGAIPPSLVGGYGSTLSNLFGWNYQTVQVGLAMDFNTRNRAAHAAVEQTVINERRLKLERERIEQGIAAQVRNAMQSIQTARQRIVAAESSAKAAKDKLDSETRLFQTGESTNFLVITRQNEHLDSLRRVVVARLDFNRAVARLQQATGVTLDTWKISVK